MKPFIIKRKLENTRKFVELVANQNPPPDNNQYEYELYAICTGFKEYNLDTLRVGQKIKLFDNYEGKTQDDINEENLLVFTNTLSIKINLAWVKNDIIEKINPTTYTLLNDRWMNAEGEYVDKMIPDPNSTEENPLPNIENPEAVLTECDYWLNLMVNVDVNDRYLIEQGFARLDLVQQHWLNEAL